MLLRSANAFCAVAIVLAVSPIAKAQSGLASVCSYPDEKTTSGEPPTSHAMTAAHRTLPLGSHARVTNRRNGRSVVVRINDRGPFLPGRIIDLSPAAAKALDFSGVAPVTVDGPHH